MALSDLERQVNFGDETVTGTDYVTPLASRLRLGGYLMGGIGLLAAGFLFKTKHPVAGTFVGLLGAGGIVQGALATKTAQIVVQQQLNRGDASGLSGWPAQDCVACSGRLPSWNPLERVTQVPSSKHSYV